MLKKLSKIEKATLIIILLSLCSFFIYLFKDPVSAWAIFLLSNFYFISIALFGAFFISVNSLGNAKWWLPIKNILISFTNYLYLGAFFSLLIYLFGFSHLYEWSHDGFASHFTFKNFYFDKQFYLLRLLLIYSLWIFLTLKIVKHSSPSQKNDILDLDRLKVYSALFLISFAIGFSIRGVDDIMALSAEWYSTIFTLYLFAGLFISSIASVIIFLIFLKNDEQLKEDTSNALFTLGRYLFAFSTFWAYIWLSQYLLIWYANIPEETFYYERRMGYGWNIPFLINLFLNWIIPFVLLISYNAKKNNKILLTASVTVLIGHFLDLYLLIKPTFSEEFSISPFEPVIFLGFLFGFILLFKRKYLKL